MKKIKFILILLIPVLISFSCEETTAPIDDKKTITCDTFPHWLFFVSGDYKPLFEIEALSINQEDFVFSWSAGYYFYSKTKNSKINLDFDKLTDGEIKYFGSEVIVLPCPYDENVFFFVLEGNNTFNQTITHWYLFNSENFKFTKVTPSKYRESGIKYEDYSTISTPRTWLNSSSKGNDQLHFRFYGTYHLQREEYIMKDSLKIHYSAVSPNGNFVWTGYLLNGKKIEGRIINDAEIIQLNRILFSTDSKFIAVIAKTDTVILNGIGDYFYELHIINVEKTLATGRVVIDKSLSIKDHFCSFRAGFTAQYVNKDKVLVSWSYQYDDRGTIYEVDMNTGKAIPLVYD